MTRERMKEMAWEIVEMFTDNHLNYSECRRVLNYVVFDCLSTLELKPKKEPEGSKN